MQHHKALPYNQVAGAIEQVVQGRASLSSKLALEFLILTASRSGEVRGALWEEVGFENDEWIVPAHRMKAKRPHRVPLSPRCLEILRQAKKLEEVGSGYVFPGSIVGKPLSDSTLSKLLKDLDINAVPHGFRSSFRDWAGEQTNFSREICEFALAHVIRDKAEAAYARSDLFEKRRKLMNTWAQYLSLNDSKIIQLKVSQSE